MTPDRYHQVTQIYHQAVELEPEQRSEFLDRVCADDIELRRDVESLVASDEQAGDFLGRPAMDVAAELLADGKGQSIAGRRIGKYQVLSLLGAGGMGEVWLARGTTRTQRCAQAPARTVYPQPHPKAIIASGAVIVLAIAGYLLWSGADTTKVPPAMRVANFTQLTIAPGQEIYPSLSPDGKLLVYAGAGAGNWDIHLQRVSGATPINLTSDSAAPAVDDTQPAFSPDGEQIVFSHSAFPAIAA